MAPRLHNRPTNAQNPPITVFSTVEMFVKYVCVALAATSASAFAPPARVGALKAAPLKMYDLEGGPFETGAVGAATRTGDYLGGVDPYTRRGRVRYGARACGGGY